MAIHSATAFMDSKTNMQNLHILERIFTAGEEPTGEMVNSYHKPKSIDAILYALDQEEILTLRRSTFGKLIATSEKQSFSGSFGQYMITRMLQVSKKNEIWFIFAGKPIRVSLREFAIVTGLPCRRYPKRSKKKTNLVKQKSNWGELFGLLPSVFVENTLRMLKRRKLMEKETRINYACLALTSLVLCPSSHQPKIVKEHVELIRDIEEFIAYPWGRLAFEKQMSSIKSKDVIVLSQRTIALKGFVQAIQLFMVETIRALTEVVQIDEVSLESDSDSDGDEEGDGDRDVAENLDCPEMKMRKGTRAVGEIQKNLSQSPGSVQGVFC